MAFCTGSDKNDKEEFIQDYCNRRERVKPKGSKDGWEQSGGVSGWEITKRNLVRYDGGGILAKLT